MRHLLLTPWIAAVLTASPAHAAQAVNAAKTAVRAASPAASEATYFKAALKAAGSGKTAYSLKVFQYLVRLRPQKALYWFNLGNVRFLSGDSAGAINPYSWVIALKSPLAPAAYLYLAKCHRRLGDRRQASAMLTALARGPAIPSNLAKDAEEERQELRNSALEDATTAYRSGDMEKTLAGLREIEALGPLSPEAQLLRGLALMKKGEGDEARRSLETVAGSGDETLRSSARELLRLARARPDPSSGSVVELSLSAGYNSNLYGDGDSEVPLGVPTVAIGGSWERMIRAPWLLSAFVALDEQVGMPEERQARAVLQAAWRSASPGLKISVSPQAELELRATTPFAARAGASLTLETTGPRSYGLHAQLLRTLPLDSQSAYLLGYSGYFRAFASAHQERVGAALSMVAMTESGLDLTLSDGLLPLAGRSLGPMISFSWKPAPKWDLDASATYLLRYFNGNAQPGDESRTDRQLAIGLRALTETGRWAQLFLSASYVRNDSTLGASSVDDKNYSQLTAQTGVIWELPR